MNNQRFFLLIAIGLSIFVLWQKWEQKQNPALYQDTQTQPITGDVLNTEDSIVPTTNAQSDIPTLVSTSPQTKAVPGISSNKTLATVTTDVLKLTLNQHSAIVTAELLDYPITLDSEEKIKLLDNSRERFFIAQSGLAPKDLLPTHMDTWTVDQSAFTLTGDTLVVPMYWSNDAVTVVKKYILSRNSYIVNVEYDITNNTGDDLTLLNYSRLSREAIEQGSMMMPTFSGGAMYDTGEEVYDKFTFDDFSSTQPLVTKGGYAAQVEHYYLGAIIPPQSQINKFSPKVSDDRFIIENVSPAVTIKNGITSTIIADSFYIGPKERERIDTAVVGLDHTVDYSWLYIIAAPLSWFIYWIFSLVGDWGVTIILFTLVIKLAFYKLSEKSYKSMAGMRKLTPRLEQLKEKYGDDKSAMAQKTMQLYKEAKVNPASGCLPILVQMPVFIALYWVLLEMVELRHTSFLYLPDLSAPDPYYIMPLLMGVSMFIQQKLNPKPTDPMQARIMMSLPFVFTIFFIWFPSGLVLYWLVNNILSIAQQWVITKRINEK